MDEKTRTVAVEIATTIRDLQGVKGLSVAELSRRSGLKCGELELILQGEAEISLPALYVIAGALEVRPGRLLNGIEWIPGDEGEGRFKIRSPGA